MLEYDEEAEALPFPEPLVGPERPLKAEPIQYTIEESSAKSVTGKIYGFFQDVGHKIKETFFSVKDLFKDALTG